MKTIGILYTGELNESLFRKYSTALSKLSSKFNLIAFKPSGINLKNKRVEGYVFKNDKLYNTQVKFPLSVYNLSHNISSGLEASLGSGKVFNILSKFDKFIIYQILQKSHNQYLIPATNEFNYSKLENFIGKNKSIVLKPKSGFQGKGILKIQIERDYFLLSKPSTLRPRKFECHKSLMQYIEEQIPKEKDYIMQEFIDNKMLDHDYFDIRIYVQKNIKGEWQVTGGLSRIAVKRLFVTNIAKEIVSHENVLEYLYAISKATELKNTIEQYSLLVARDLENNLCTLGEMSVDFILDPFDQPYILEVNSQPMKSIVGRLSDKPFLNKVYSRPMEYAIYLSNPN